MSWNVPSAFSGWRRKIKILPLFTSIDRVQLSSLEVCGRGLLVFFFVLVGWLADFFVSCFCFGWPPFITHPSLTQAKADWENRFAQKPPFSCRDPLSGQTLTRLEDFLLLDTRGCFLFFDTVTFVFFSTDFSKLNSAYLSPFTGLSQPF